MCLAKEKLREKETKACELQKGVEGNEMGLGRRGKRQVEKEMEKSRLRCWSVQNRENWGELPGIQTSGWAGCTSPES